MKETPMQLVGQVISFIFGIFFSVVVPIVIIMAAFKTVF